MRLTVGGVFVYAGTSLLLFVEAVRLVLLESLWAEGVFMAPVSLVVVTSAAALLFGAGAVTRQPLIESGDDAAANAADAADAAGAGGDRVELGDGSRRLTGLGVGPGGLAGLRAHGWLGSWFGSMGWAVLVALTALSFVISML
jgi:hypothetical protein